MPQEVLLPPFENFWSALPEFFAWLEGGNEPILAPVPIPAGERALRPAVGDLRRRGIPGSSFLEAIRFAGANRLCVELDYVNEQGRRRPRVVAPYALRRTAAGHVIVRAVHVDSDSPRSYRIDRIRGARVTDRTFIPRFEVELSATEPGANDRVTTRRRPAPA